MRILWVEKVVLMPGPRVFCQKVVLLVLSMASFPADVESRQYLKLTCDDVKPDEVLPLCVPLLPHQVGGPNCSS